MAARVDQYINLETYGLVNARDGVRATVAEYSRGFRALRETLDGPAAMGLSPATPMAIRQVVEAQLMASCQRVNQSPVTDQGIRSKNFFAATIGFGFTLIARIIRVVFRTGFAIITIPYAYHQQQRYNVEGWCKNECKRIAYEWIDLAATLAIPFIGLINTISPEAIPLNRVRDYYHARVLRVQDQNAHFAAQKAEYFANRAAVREGARDAEV